MLTGQYQHNMDAKGRVTIPAKFREELGETFCVCRGIDGCLFALSMEQWDKLAASLTEKPMAQARALQRAFFSTVEEVTPDKQGRILLPPNLRALGGLEKDVTVVGMMTRAEIWDTGRWEAYNQSQTDEALEEMMDALQI